MRSKSCGGLEEKKKEQWRRKRLQPELRKRISKRIASDGKRELSPIYTKGLRKREEAIKRITKRTRKSIKEGRKEKKVWVQGPYDSHEKGGGQGRTPIKAKKEKTNRNALNAKKNGGLGDRDGLPEKEGEKRLQKLSYRMRKRRRKVLARVPRKRARYPHRRGSPAN